MKECFPCGDTLFFYVYTALMWVSGRANDLFDFCFYALLNSFRAVCNCYYLDIVLIPLYYFVYNSLVHDKNIGTLI